MNIDALLKPYKAAAVDTSKRAGFGYDACGVVVRSMAKLRYRFIQPLLAGAFAGDYSEFTIDDDDSAVIALSFGDGWVCPFFPASLNRAVGALCTEKE